LEFLSRPIWLLKRAEFRFYAHLLAVLTKNISDHRLVETHILDLMSKLR
jgi:hypothetical protein